MHDAASGPMTLAIPRPAPGRRLAAGRLRCGGSDEGGAIKGTRETVRRC